MDDERGTTEGPPVNAAVSDSLPAEYTEQAAEGTEEAAEGTEVAPEGTEPATGDGWPAPADGTAGAWQLHEAFGRGAGAPRAVGPAEGVAHAEFGLRAVAFAFDLTLVWAGTSIGAAFLLPVSRQLLGSADGSTRTADAVTVTLIGVALLAAAAYSMAVLRGSPGQLALGLATVGRRRGGALPVLVAAVRQLVLLGPGFLVPVVGVFVPLVVSDQDLYAALAVWLPLVGLAWYVLLAFSALASARGQGLHDLLVGSLVIREVEEAE